MYQKFLHNRWLQLLTGILGSLLMALAINLFIVPQGLYTGGLYGVCMVIRTLLATKAGVVVTAFDLAGLLYLLTNIPLMILAWRSLGRQFVVRLIICTVANSLFLSLIPIPAAPIISDRLTSCMIGGIVTGLADGLVLTCGCSTGGLDVIGLYLSKKGSRFTVGRFSIAFNAVLYTCCAILFSLDTAIYSSIYMVFSALFVDRVHQQNISVQMLIFSKEKTPELKRYIMEQLERGVTCWDGKGGYTDETVQVLCVCLSKYEVISVQEELRRVDAHAFFVVQEGVRIGGNFERHLS